MCPTTRVDGKAGPGEIARVLSRHSLVVITDEFSELAGGIKHLTGHSAGMYEKTVVINGFSSHLP